MVIKELFAKLGWRRGAPAIAATPPAAADPHVAWAMRELAPWRFRPVDRDYAETSFRSFNESKADIFVYRFAAGSVEMDTKSVSLGTDKSTANRAQKYLAFFCDAAARLPSDFSATLAMGCGDKVEFAADVPVFCFQKRRGNLTVLAPDIDFLDFNFYEGEEFNDTVRYEDKIDKAIFVGGTTGGAVTVDAARTCSLPRLRAARFFWGNQRVDFLLPQIVQTANEEARALLEKMPFCRPGRMGWKQQLTRRFLISMDGNGATCSRVAIALRSNSVLLKYDSDELLYYFQGLQPFLHYIPIARDTDVEKTFDLDAWAAGTLEDIARAGAAFGARHLTREATTDYMARLLTLYAACFTGSIAVSPPAPKPAQTPAEKLFLLAHIENVGDREADSQGWVGISSNPNRLEGFEVSCSAPWWPTQVTYQAVLADQSLGPRIAGGDYCGTRGKQQPIHGYVLNVASDAPTGFQIVCDAIFRDEFRLEGALPGTLCVSPGRAPLVAMRMTIKRAATNG